MIRLDDGFYNVDTTWDDTGDGTYDYFNKTDADYASSHIRRDLSVYLPPCNGQVWIVAFPGAIGHSKSFSHCNKVGASGLIMMVFNR